MVIEMVSKEMEYILKNREALEKEYSGKYIAVHQEEIVASGKTIHEVYSAVKELNISNTLVIYVPREGEEHFLYEISVC